MAVGDIAVKKLGIEWGAAYEEAQPIEVTAVGNRFQVYIGENYDVCIEVPAYAKITFEGGNFFIRLPNQL